ncbi:protein unc-93 homolog A-like [Centruroides vittatus]|uniref:protein unc-93 homolog A-like n=1 Tax=Centruroides vittatus TaxID=120091 RepID=UPI00350FBD6B
MLSTPIMRSSETLLTPRPIAKAVSKTRNNPENNTSSNQHSPQEQQLTKNQLIGWTVILGISFTFVCTSFAALQNILSSLFIESGIGIKSLICVYAVAAISPLYSQFFVNRLTPNWVIVVSFVMTALYITVYFYPRIYTLTAAGILLGLLLGPLRCASTSFLVQTAGKLTARSTDVSRELTIRRQFGHFTIFINSGQVWGNLLTSLLLHYGDDIYIYPTGPKLTHAPNSDFSPPANVANPSLSRTMVNPSLCNADHCKKWEVFRNSIPFAFIVPSNVSLMLISVYLGLAFVGVALATSLLDKFDIREEGAERVTFVETAKSYLLSFIDPQLRLVFPLIFFYGLQYGFIVADFTRSYVSCYLGMEAVGYALMIMGLTHTLSAFLVYQVPKCINRLIIAFVGFSFHGGLLTILWLWRPIKEDIVIFNIIAAIWGVCSAIWEALTTSFIIKTSGNDLHPALLSHYSILSLALSLAFASSFYLCTEIKLYILISTLILSIGPYSLAEYRLHQQNKTQERTAVL